MNYTKLFYWLVVADNAKAFFVAFIIIFTIISLIATIAFFAASAQSEAEYQKMSRKWMWWSYPFMVLFWALYVFTPNKKDALLIVAGGQIANFMTSDSTARQIPHEALTFVVTELKSMASDAKVDLGINDQKSKILEEAKQMTATELMEKMKVDTTFAKVILNK
jgi:hypothetical protein